MKFKTYLNEENIGIFNKNIQKDCQYYLNITKGIYMFKRGLQNQTKGYGVKSVRQDREPRGMNR
jgi:hypothetical protein